MPRRLSALTEDLAELAWPGPDHSDQFRSFAALVGALYHHEFHRREQNLLDAWADLESDGAEARASGDHITAELTGLLDAANYELATMDELGRALQEESLIPLRFDIDLDDYDEVVIARRGSRFETVEVPRWGGLRTDHKSITLDERVVVHTRIKPAAWFEERDIDPEDRNLVPGHVSLKQFQNVPRADIEMLLPSTQVRFRRIDSLLMGVPAVVSGIAVLSTKLLPTLLLLFLLAAAGLGLRDESPDIDQAALAILFGGVLTLGGFLFRQWNKLKNRRVKYLKTLTENLYFRTLGDGPGVLHSLLAAAEQQEVVEVLLGYRFLLAAPDGLTASELDRVAEHWLASTAGGDEPPIDFEVDDALVKLARLGIVEGRTNYRALPLDQALALLDQRWDDLFRHRVEPGPEPDGTNRAVGAVGGGAQNRPRPGPLLALRRVVDRFSGRLDRRRLRRERDDEQVAAPEPEGPGTADGGPSSDDQAPSENGTASDLVPGDPATTPTPAGRS